MFHRNACFVASENPPKVACIEFTSSYMKMKGAVMTAERMVVMAWSLAAVSLVRSYMVRGNEKRCQQRQKSNRMLRANTLKSFDKFFLAMDRRANAMFPIIAITAVVDVSSFDIVATSSLPSVDAYATP